MTKREPGDPAGEGLGGQVPDALEGLTEPLHRLGEEVEILAQVEAELAALGGP